MTNLRKAAQQALEALQEYQSNGAPFLACDGAAAALRAALAQQDEPVQEPVAWMRHDNRVAEESYSRTQFSRGRDKPPIGTWTPLYTSTQQAEPTRSQRLADAGFTRRHSLWALQARQALELIAAPQRPDGTWNRDREACRQLAAEALGRYDDE